MSYQAVAAHRSMALDRVRNQAYACALRQVINDDSVVLDLGAGTGVLGLMAARMGAKHVYLVEPEDIIAVAEKNVTTNGLQDRVTCIQGRIEDVQLPERVDVIISVLTGNFLLTEDLLGTLFHARDTMLKPGGYLVPSAASMKAVPVSVPELHAEEIGAWSAAQHEVDLGSARTYAANTIFYGPSHLREATYLAEPSTLHTVDFHESDYSTVDADVHYEVTETGACHGWVGWLTIKLGDSWLSTSPRDKQLHWSPVFLPVDPPIELEKGQRVSFTLHRAPFGEWTWQVTTDTTSQKRSTFLSLPLKAATFKKAAPDYTPVLGPEGRALAYAVSRCDGSTTVTDIAASVRQQWPTRYRTDTEAMSFVQQVVKRFA